MEGGDAGRGVMVGPLKKQVLLLCLMFLFYTSCDPLLDLFLFPLRKPIYTTNTNMFNSLGPIQLLYGGGGTELSHGH